MKINILYKIYQATIYRHTYNNNYITKPRSIVPGCIFSRIHHTLRSLNKFYLKYCPMFIVFPFHPSFISAPPPRLERWIEVSLCIYIIFYLLRSVKDYTVENRTELNATSNTGVLCSGIFLADILHRQMNFQSTAWPTRCIQIQNI
jgi:hypothetical protein